MIIQQCQQQPPPSQVRVIQGKEPNHFMSMFGGRLVIYNGGKAGWTQGEVDVDGPGDHYLLHVRGQTQFNTKAEQVTIVSHCLALSRSISRYFIISRGSKFKLC